jgi:uncharacterized membrane protein (UPF0127 family)
MKIKLFPAVLILLFCIFCLASCSGSDSGGGSDDLTPGHSMSVTISATPSQSPSASPYPSPQAELPRKTVTIRATSISAEIADDDKERQSGLSWRTSLGKNDGMLFVFEEKNYYSVWMYGMGFPLDLIWINDNKVVYINENVPNPSDPFSTNIPSYSPDVKINYFLEVNAGFVKNHGIKVGDSFKVE